MPSYTYKCHKTQQIIERYASIKNHSRVVKCECGSDAEQIILTAPITIIPQHMRYDWEGYESPVTGTPITNMRQRANDLARHDCIEYDPGMKQDADRRIKEDDLRIDKLVDETVEREFDAMPVQKKERLEAELTAGATIELERV